MAFTTWSALKTAILDAMADKIGQDICVGEYTVKGRRIVYHNWSELEKLYEWACRMESIESGYTPGQTVSYGRYVQRD